MYLQMTMGQILLRRPWQFDRRVLLDDYTNTYSHWRDERKLVLQDKEERSSDDD